MLSPAATAREEWRHYWVLAVAACIGYSNAGLHTYMLGPLMAPLHRDFGWSRVQISSGIALVNALSVVGSPLIGVLVDRLGPRRIALAGVLLVPGAISLMATATGTVANWLALWAAVGVAFLAVNGAVWSSAVASRFRASRGLALAVTLTGASVSTMVVPLLMTSLIGHFGWRTALVSLGAIWAAVTFPVQLFFFRGAQDVGRSARAEARAAAARLPGMTLHQALKRPAFYKLIAAGALFAVCILGSAVHFIPMLVGAGASPMTAASAAATIGVFSIVGRLVSGVLLDRFPGQIVGAVATFIPAVGAAVLLWGGAGPLGYFIAAASFGLTLGSELDLMSYLAAHQFGLKKYGVILGVLLGAIAFGGVVGPLAAGASFDRFGDYRVFLAAIVGLTTAASLLIGSIRRPPDWGAPAEFAAVVPAG